MKFVCIFSNFVIFVWRQNRLVHFRYTKAISQFLTSALLIKFILIHLNVIYFIHSLQSKYTNKIILPVCCFFMRYTCIDNQNKSVWKFINCKFHQNKKILYTFSKNQIFCCEVLQVLSSSLHINIRQDNLLKSFLVKLNISYYDFWPLKHPNSKQRTFVFKLCRHCFGKHKNQKCCGKQGSIFLDEVIFLTNIFAYLKLIRRFKFLTYQTPNQIWITYEIRQKLFDLTLFMVSVIYGIATTCQERDV